MTGQRQVLRDMIAESVFKPSPSYEMFTHPGYPLFRQVNVVNNLKAREWYADLPKWKRWVLKVLGISPMQEWPSWIDFHEWRELVSIDENGHVFLDTSPRNVPQEQD